MYSGVPIYTADPGIESIPPPNALDAFRCGGFCSIKKAPFFVYLVM